MPRRQVIKVPGMGHGANPIPVAVKMGSVIYTGGISPSNPETGTTSEDAKEQIAQAFANMKKILDAAGASLDDVVKLDVKLKNLADHRGLLNEEWVKHFPDETNRPVRKTDQAALGGSMLIQMEMIAQTA
ncbi:MAG: RidA family protein [Chloroflexi bacterium]|nr:RidA family protein [Chloroflexota bacterium]